MKRKALKREWNLIDVALREGERLHLSMLQPLNDLRSRVTVEVMNANFKKYHLGGGLALHHFAGADLGDPHDHPGSFATQIIKPYVEDIYTIHPDGSWSIQRVERKAGTTHVVPASTIHKIVALPEGESLTFVQYGPHEQRTRFYRFGDNVMWRDWRQRSWTTYR